MNRLSPLDAFIWVLCKYLADRGGMVFSLAEASGQKKLVVSLYGLWRRHRYWETGYRAFMEIVKEIYENKDLMSRLRELGVEALVINEEEPYIVINIDKIRRLLNCAETRERIEAKKAKPRGSDEVTCNC